MQYIDDDMDELFRRAAEDYDLNTNSADWNAVVKKLSANSSGISGDKKQPAKKYKRLLLLLLLLPVAWLGKEYLFQNQELHSGDSIAEHISKNSLSSSKPVIKVLESIAPETFVDALPGDQGTNTQVINQRKVYSRKGSLESFIVAPAMDNTNLPNPTPGTGNDKTGEQTPVTTVVVMEQLKTSNENSTTRPDNNQHEKNTTVSKNKNKKPAAKGLYAGILVSPDISMVKLQGTKNIGLSAGFVIGYQINKNIDVETGLAWNKKYYHSDGKYFNPKNIVLQPYAKVKELDGTCEMIEIPVMIRYNFKRSAKGNVSVAGGMSSYIMKRENYDYTIERNGAQYPRNADYKNSSTDMFAVANIGVAYNRSLGKNTVLRLEPYIKIPVKGVGIGDLPIMSTGINIAVTKKLFK